MVGFRARMPARPTVIGDDAVVEHTVVDAGTAPMRFIEIERT
ncbi:hypothetical protein C8J32_101738 [Rhizobium sp. PP-CC-3A-592]|nr:hypothetical protein C8J32_101738 [Rhizobium sp. PP-CC-3A-592]